MKRFDRPHRAFTLIELLVVVGIIVVLIAIVTVGMRTVVDTASRHETAAELKICTDMLKAYQSINGLGAIEGPPGPPMTDDQKLKLPYPPWLNRWYSTPIYMDYTVEFIGVQPATAIGWKDFAGTRSPNGPRESGDDGDLGDKSDMNNPRWTSRAVYNTTGIMFLLLKDPKNRAIMSGLPPTRILETWPPSSVGDPPQAPFTIEAAVPLDGWGNPIVYVPRGGMHIWMNPTDGKNPVEYVVRSSGTYLVPGQGQPAPPVPPVGPADRPFFASAGRDGYFTDTFMHKNDRGIDNMYSFQEQ